MGIGYGDWRPDSAGRSLIFEAPTSGRLGVMP